MVYLLASQLRFLFCFVEMYIGFFLSSFFTLAELLGPINTCICRSVELLYGDFHANLNSNLTTQTVRRNREVFSLGHLHLNTGICSKCYMQNICRTFLHRIDDTDSKLLCFRFEFLLKYSLIFVC